MKKSLFTLIVFIITISLFPQASSARTGYVSDMLFLTFRQGPGNSYAVEKTLMSNTPVVVLEERSGFYKVELKSKEVGWVDKNFIIFTLPKTLMINKLGKENKSLSNKIIELQSSVGELQDELSSVKQNYSQTKEKLEISLKTALDEKNKTTNMLSDTQGEYNTLTRQSKDIQEIVKENKVLKEQTQTLSEELEIIKEKSKNLFKTGMIKWFLTGSGVLLLGWIIGQSVSSRKQKSSSLLR